MALCKQQNLHDFLEEEEEEDDDDDDYSGEFDCDCDSDSDIDPIYSIQEETRDQLSNLSIKKNSNTVIEKDVDVDDERDQQGVDDKSFREVQSIIEAGKQEKLKVEQCKLYLRKNGLRLTGKKETLIQRIMEHQEILNGGGEKKYPVSSFVLNCKGDACTGDVVMFEQIVYETYNIASRSATGPPCGTRTVVGRIVKESYGAAKQQHTFTIEVLWSKGKKPLPPLHPLLIKGRNLYRLKTLRQKWEDERKRQKILMEKHSRGSLARCARESRIQDKEIRKAFKENRGLKKERNRNSQLNSTLKGNQGIQKQQLGSSANWEEAAPGPQRSSLSSDSGKVTIGTDDSGMSIEAVKMGGEAQKQAIQPQHSGSVKVGAGTQQPAITLQPLRPSRPLQSTIQPQNSGSSMGVVNMSTRTQQLQIQNQQSDLFINSIKPTNQVCSGLPCQTEHKIKRENDNFYQVPGKSVDLRGIQEVHQHNNNNFGSWLSSDQHHPVRMYPTIILENGFSERYHHRQLLTSMNYYQQRKQCKFYAQGRCYYGDNCKYLHDLGKNLPQGGREEAFCQSRLGKGQY